MFACSLPSLGRIRYFVPCQCRGRRTGHTHPKGIGLLPEALWRESLRSSMLRRVCRYWGLSTADERAVSASSNRTAPSLPLVCAVPHRHQNCAHPDYICPGIGAPLPQPSAQGLGSPCPHPSALGPDVSPAGLGSPRPNLPGLGPTPTALPHLRRDSAAVRSGRDRRQLVHGTRSSDLLAMRQLPRKFSVQKRCAHKPRHSLSHACTARTPVGAS